MDFVIETNNLSKKFSDRLVLDNINIKIGRGAAFGFLGPNGAGKTTTVRLLNGLLKPTAGKAFILSKDIEKEGDFIRTKCGVQTDVNLYERLTVQDNLMIWGALYGINGEKLKTQIEKFLRIFDLSARRNDMVGNLSKGMKQKLAIARELIFEPEILFLDEPTAGLDPEASNDVLQYLKKYIKDGKRTIFLCSHRLEEVEFLCDSVAIIYRGKILISGKTNELAGQLWNEKVFIIRLEKVKQDFIESLKREQYVSRAVSEGNEIRLSLKEDRDIARAVKALVALGGDILSVEKEQHTLKDIYFKVVPN